MSKTQGFDKRSKKAGSFKHTTTPYAHKDWINMQDNIESRDTKYINISEKIPDDLRAIIDKLMMLKNVIQENFIGYTEKIVKQDHSLVLSWISAVLKYEHYPFKEQLISANNLWRKYSTKNVSNLHE